MREKESSQKGITLIVSSRVIMGALYRPKKVKGCPSDKTLKEITQNIENISLTLCLCLGLDPITHKEAFRLK